MYQKNQPDNVLDLERGDGVYWWIRVGLTTLKGVSAISANAQSLHGATSAQNIKITWSTEPKSLVQLYNLPLSSKTKPIIIGK